LLRAQLLEEGLDVAAYDRLEDALDVLRSSFALPNLLLADVSSSDHPAADLDALATWTPKVPMWIIASRQSLSEDHVRGFGFDRVLFRPVDVGWLVAEIEERVNRYPAGDFSLAPSPESLAPGLHHGSSSRKRWVMPE